MPTTNNSLADFNFCLAIAQSALNAQLAEAWKVWTNKRVSKIKDTIEIFKRKELTGAIVDSSHGMRATFAAPTVDLNVPNAQGTQVRVTMALKSGEVVWDDAQPPYPIQNWTISFLCNLDKRGIKLSDLEKIDANAAKTAKEVVGISESIFSIEYLFLKFNEVDLFTGGATTIINTPANILPLARLEGVRSLNMLLQGEIREFVVGTVVRRNSKQAAPTFALTDFVLDVRPNGSAPAAATLNYLGMLAGHKFPGDLETARKKLSKPWVQPQQLTGKESMVSGVMGFSTRVFTSQYLVSKFKAALKGVEWGQVLGTPALGRRHDYNGPDPIYIGPMVRFEEKMETGSKADDTIGWQEIRLQQGYGLNISFVPDAVENQITIAGSIECNVRFQGKFKPLGLLDEKVTQEISVEGSQEFRGSLNLKGNGIGTNFTLESKLSYEFQPRVMHPPKTDFFTGVFKSVTEVAKMFNVDAGSVDAVYVQAQESTSKRLLETLDAAFKRLDADFSQQCFIPPGGGVFTFSNPTFSNAGDLYFDVIYLRS